MIKFCTQCGTPVEYKIPDGDNRQRAVCRQCAHIHYENPRLVVGCISEWQDRILLCRRAIEPRHGYWTLPAGFMENNESTTAAAIRETLEEACSHIVVDAPLAMVSIPHINQIHLFYRGRLLDGQFSPGEESLETRLFSEESLPWEDLAFRSVRFALERFLEDRRRRNFAFHSSELSPL